MELFGNRRIAVARELTKKFEEIFRGNVDEAIEKFQAVLPRGEFTVVIAGKE
jgi:16S rRNA (cytidine1402-2'-O)-methyltransferase